MGCAAPSIRRTLPQADRLLCAAGLATAGYVVFTLALAFRRPNIAPRWRGIAVRAVGGRIAAFGLMMAGLSLAP
ncbi:conserved hypothetical protein [Bradyrhizobium sp. ORS 375]|uniref:hypothetical protein n=1 Tax=Bradyrhizobium sp. (strain ORS 375) TaxID=566679 RepID=UPI0002408ADC|nr:conserved hypothetical protein [Bradyrhizobium sp. ORS 375]